MIIQIILAREASREEDEEEEEEEVERSPAVSGRMQGPVEEMLT